MYFRQGHAQAMGQQQASVNSGKELPPAHQASLPQSQVVSRSNPVYQPTGYTSVTPQVKLLNHIKPYIKRISLLLED